MKLSPQRHPLRLAMATSAVLALSGCALLAPPDRGLILLKQQAEQQAQAEETARKQRELEQRAEQERQLQIRRQNLEHQLALLSADAGNCAARYADQRHGATATATEIADAAVISCAPLFDPIRQVTEELVDTYPAGVVSSVERQKWAKAMERNVADGARGRALEIVVRKRTPKN